MFSVCVVFEINGQTASKWLSVRSMVDALHQIDQAIIAFQIKTNNAPVDRVRIMMDYLDLVKAARR